MDTRAQRWTPGEHLATLALGAFARKGSVWTLNTHFLHSGVMFTLRVLDGESRVRLSAAPVP